MHFLLDKSEISLDANIDLAEGKRNETLQPSHHEVLITTNVISKLYFLDNAYRILCEYFNITFNVMMFLLSFLIFLIINRPWVLSRNIRGHTG